MAVQKWLNYQAAICDGEWGIVY